MIGANLNPFNYLTLTILLYKFWNFRISCEQIYSFLSAFQFCNNNLQNGLDSLLQICNRIFFSKREQLLACTYQFLRIRIIIDILQAFRYYGEFKPRGPSQKTACQMQQNVWCHTLTVHVRLCIFRTNERNNRNYFHLILNDRILKGIDQTYRKISIVCTSFINRSL